MSAISPARAMSDTGQKGIWPETDSPQTASTTIFPCPDPLSRLAATTDPDKETHDQAAHASRFWTDQGRDGLIESGLVGRDRDYRGRNLSVTTRR